MQTRSFKDSRTGFSGWLADLPERRGLCTPAVDGGRLFVGAGFGSYAFYALDARTGRLAWHRRTSDDGPTAAVHCDGRVVFNTESCTVFALDAASGEVAWERWLGDPLLAQPAAADGRVFMAYPARGAHCLAALDLADGRHLWEVPITADVITAPVVAEGAVYISTWDGQVWSFDAESGAVRSCENLNATSAPWVWRGEIYVARREAGRGGAADVHESVWARKKASWARHTRMQRAAYLESKRLTPRGDRQARDDAAVGFGAAPPAAKLGYSEARVGEHTVSGAWRHQGSRPCVWNGCLFTTTGERLSATDAESGEEVWSWRAPQIADDRALSPPAVVNGRVYAGSHGGTLYSWEADTGRVRWEARLGGAAIWQPAIHDGWIYTGLEHGRVVALHTGDPLDDGWAMWGGGPGHNGATGSDPSSH
jgi:Ca-activated chloride channel family protein